MGKLETCIKSLESNLNKQPGKNTITLPVNTAANALDLLKEIAEPKKLTNKEWLATLTPDQWWLEMDWLFHKYGKRYDNSYIAIVEWLSMSRDAWMEQTVKGEGIWDEPFWQ